jgi:hypothetical protein
MVVLLAAVTTLKLTVFIPSEPLWSSRQHHDAAGASDLRTLFMAATLLIAIAAAQAVAGIASTLDLALSVTGTMTPIAGVKGTVHGINSAGERVPVSGGLVEAHYRSTESLASSTRTQVDGTFNLPLSPGDYNLTVSASPPASNISPAFIMSHALAYITPSLIATVEGVNVSLTPRLSERDLGGSCLTDSDGFCKLTVWPYYPLRPYSTTVRVSEETNTSISVDLERSVVDQGELSVFYVTFSHPEYPVGPEYPVNHVLKILPGQSYNFEGYMNTWPTVTTTVVLDGRRYSVGVNGYSYSTLPAWNLRFDAGRRLINFTVSDTYLPTGKIAEFVALIPKPLLDGSPMVFVDNVVVPSTLAQNASHYFVRFRYNLTFNEMVTHSVMVGGSNTIQEYTSPFLSLSISVAFVYIFLRGNPKRKKARMQAWPGCQDELS